MTPKSRIFQTNSPTALLSSTALVIVLIVTASPAQAEPVTLSCRTESGSATYTFRINYATGLVEQLAPSGNAYTDRLATATISPNAIIWSIDQPSSYLTGDGVTHQTTEHWEGHIDRLAATGWVESHKGDFPTHPIDIICRQATQKF